MTRTGTAGSTNPSSADPDDDDEPLDWHEVEDNRDRYQDADQGEDTMANLGFIPENDHEPSIEEADGDDEGSRPFWLALGTVLVTVPAALGLTWAGLTAVPVALLALAGAVLVAYIRP
jgi:hypothetical protein